MESGQGILVLVVFLAALAVFFIVVLRHWGNVQAASLEKRIKQEFEFTQKQLVQMAGQIFETQQEKARSELESRRQAIEGTVQGLKEELHRYQELMRQFEQDRERKYGSLENELKNASQVTSRLQETTHRLNNILGNVKLRGQWGERMAEDIIRHVGLIEGINYQKQKQLSSSSTKPDYTFFLPNNHCVNMDVKFPLDNYTQMMNVDDERRAAQFEKEFLRNVRERIKEIQNRSYINPEERTLDFVLLFIPNEQVFALIQERAPDLLDYALRQKVVLCSPFTLYAMLSVIRQAYENFRFEKDLKKIIRLIDQFAVHYDRFKGRFEDLGTAIDKVSLKYRDIREKSFQQLETKIRHIDNHKKGKHLSSSLSDDQESLPLESDLSAETITDAQVLE